MSYSGKSHHSSVTIVVILTQFGCLIEIEILFFVKVGLYISRKCGLFIMDKSALMSVA